MHKLTHNADFILFCRLISLTITMTFPARNFSNIAAQPRLVSFLSQMARPKVSRSYYDTAEHHLRSWHSRWLDFYSGATRIIRTFEAYRMTQDSSNRVTWPSSYERFYCPGAVETGNDDRDAAPLTGMAQNAEEKMQRKKNAIILRPTDLVVRHIASATKLSKDDPFILSYRGGGGGLPDMNSSSGRFLFTCVISRASDLRLSARVDASCESIV